MKPYPYQRRCINALWSAYREERGRALFQMATGLGKTVTAGLFLERWLKEQLGRILVLCHQNYLIEQLRDRIMHVVGRRYSTGLFHGQKKARGRPDLLFGSFQTMIGRREDFAADEFSLVLVDEAHHAMADTFEPTLRYFTPRFLLGMTATVEREDGRDIRELFGPEVFSLGTADALAQELLSPVRYSLFLDSNRTLEQALGGVEPEKCSIRDFEERFFDHRTEEEIARIIVERMSRVRGSRAIIFGSDVEQCNRVHRLLAAHLPSAALHYEVDDEDRRTRLEAFRSGELRVLSTRDMLNEGIDVPEVTHAVFLRATGSRRIFLQQLGRALRRHAEKDEVEVLDFVANCERLMLAKQFEEEVHEAEVREGRTNGRVRSRFKLVDADAQRELALIPSIKDVLEVLARIESGWTKESALEALRRLHASLGRPIAVNDINDASKQGLCPSTTFLARHFDPEDRSHIPALKAADIPTASEEWTEETALESLRRLHASLGRPISVLDILEARKERLCPPVQWLVSHFCPEKRSHIPALRAAGVPPASTKWTKDAALEALRQLHASLGKPLSEKDIREASSKRICPSKDWYCYQFDPEGRSHIPALRAAGVPSASDDQWTKESALESLRRLHESLGRPIGQKEIEEASKKRLCPSVSWLRKSFDPAGRSLCPALEAAGVPTAFVKRPKWTKRSAVAAIKRLYRSLRRPVAKRDLQEASKSSLCPSVSWLCRHFDPEGRTYRGALEAAGVPAAR